MFQRGGWRSSVRSQHIDGQVVKRAECEAADLQAKLPRVTDLGTDRCTSSGLLAGYAASQFAPNDTF